MNTALLFGHVLTCLVAVHFFTVDGQSTCCPTESCCSNTCAAPPAQNLSLVQLVAIQPIYVNILPAIPLFAGVDNMCYTFIPLPDGTYLLSVNTVYSNGFNQSQEFTILQTDLGVAELGSATCNAQSTIFDIVNTTDCFLYLEYLCFNYGSCSFAPGDNIPVFGLSTNASAVSQSCLATAMQYISNDGVDSQGYFILPYNLSTACVTNITCSI